MKFHHCTLLIATAIVMNSCLSDIVENDYATFELARKGGFNGNGYLPSNFFNSSSRNIRTILNIDSQEALIKYQIEDSSEFNNLISLLKPCSNSFIEPRTFEIPTWWNMDELNTSKLCFYDEYHRKFQLAIHLETQTIFSWDNLEK